MMKNPDQSSRSLALSISKVILTIAIFLLVYLAFIFVSLGLLVACGYFVAFIISIRIGFVSLALGSGAVALSIMFFVFLIKFIFTRYKNENPYRIRVVRKDYPELFDFIEAVADEVGTKRPRKVFVSHDVNACVFYNSSFLSLFLPVRKNLEIGLGLVNSVNKGEFKAILAHEFGHFSQKSMSLGSYVYTVNHVLYNLVYERDRWDRTLVRWSEAGGIFGFFANLTHWLVESVRWVLRKTYDLINLSYLGLSRELEYQADAIAAQVAGAEVMVSALRRIEYSGIVYQLTLNSMSTFASEKKLLSNTYEHHCYQIKKLAGYHNLKMENTRPIINDKDLETNVIIPRVLFKNQWASHPSRQEREEALYRDGGSLNYQDLNDTWQLFNNKTQIQESVTRRLYEVDYEVLVDYQTISEEECQKSIEAEVEKYAVNELFNKFYSDRLLTSINIDELDKTGDFDRTIYEKLYSATTKARFEKLENDSNDLLVLQQIEAKQIPVKYFDFDGVKYRAKEASEIIKKLSKELEELNEELLLLDKQSFNINLVLARELGVEFELKYNNRLKKVLEYIDITNLFREYPEALSQYQNLLYSKPNWTEGEILSVARECEAIEVRFRSTVKSFIDKGYVNMDKIVGLQSYISNTSYFMLSTSFEMDRFNNLLTMVFNIYDDLNRSYTLFVKDLTDYQAEMYYERIKVNECV